MFRLHNLLGARASRSPALSKCFATEAQKNFEEMDREKKIKIIELEISVKFCGFNRESSHERGFLI